MYGRIFQIYFFYKSNFMAMTKTKKIILISALEGLAALAVAALLVFSLWILCSPQTMATACEKTGNYSFAVTCAGLKYKYSNDTDDLARCVQDSILSGKDKYIIEYGESFLDKDDFEEVCEKKGGNFKVAVCGSLALSQYNAGDIQKAVATCETGGGASFIKLTVAVAENGSAEDINTVKTALSEQPQSEIITKLLNLLNTGE